HLGGAQARRLLAYEFATAATREANAAEKVENADLVVRGFPTAPGVAHVASGGGARRAYLVRENIRDPFHNVIAPWRLAWSQGASDEAHQTCAHPLCDDVRPKPAWRPASNEIIFTTQSKDGVSSVVGWDVARGAVRRIAAIQGVLGGGNGYFRSLSSGCPVTA